jgi:hypothetical protein
MQRQVLVAEYTTSHYFKVPKGIDLDDKNVVECWNVKYGTLYIKYKGKEEVEEIEGIMSEPDFKYACEQYLDDAEHFEWLFEEDEM